MSIQYVTEYSLVNLFFIYLLDRFMVIFFNKKEEKNQRRILIYFIGYSVNSIGNLVFNNPIVNMVTSIFVILLISSIYKAQFLQRIAATFMIYSICIICDVAESRLLGDYIIGKRLDIVNIIIVYLLIFITEIILEKHIQLKTGCILYKKQSITAIGVPVVSIVIICILVINKININEVIFGVSIGLLAINVLVFYLYDLLYAAYEKKYRNVLLEKEVMEYKNQLNLISESQKKIEGVRHDFKHHLLALKNLAEKNNNVEIIKYLKSIDTFSENKNMYVQSGNSDIDSILNYFIKNAKDHNIKVMVNIKIGVKMNIDFFDLNVVVGNLMENATEASTVSKEKIIMLSMELDRNVLYFNVKNSYNNKLNTDGRQILTNKKEKELHGYGLQNIQTIVDKYNGKMDITYDEQYFETDVMLYLNL